MKITLLSTGSPEYDVPPHLGGIQKQIRGVAVGYQRLGNEVDIVARQNRSSPDADDDNVRPIRVNSNHEVLARLIFSHRAAAIIENLKPDLLELHERFSAFFPSRLERRKVFFARNYDAMRYYARFSRSRRLANWAAFPVKHWVEEECMRRSDLVFTLNRRDTAYLRARGFGRVEHTINAVDPDAFHAGPDEDYVLFAGRLDAVKGIRVLQEAFESIAKEVNVNLHVAGDGPLRPALEKWSKKPILKARVRMLGWLKSRDLADQYSHCSFLVLPSYFETFGNVVTEAMASGKAVIASRIPGPEEVVEFAKTGFLFAPGNSEELAHYMRILAQDSGLRRRMGVAARHEAENRYSYLAVASERISAYERLLRNEVHDGSSSHST